MKNRHAGIIQRGLCRPDTIRPCEWLTLPVADASGLIVVNIRVITVDPPATRRGFRRPHLSRAAKQRGFPLSRNKTSSRPSSQSSFAGDVSRRRPERDRVAYHPTSLATLHPAMVREPARTYFVRGSTRPRSPCRV